MINKQQYATAAPRRSKTGFGFSQTGRRLRLWEPLSIGQDEARPVLASAKPGAVSAFGLYFPTGKSPQLETRREMAVDSGRDARLVRNRPGETRSASPGLSGKAKVAVPVFRLPQDHSVPRSVPQAKRSGDLGGHEDYNSATLARRAVGWRQLPTARPGESERQRRLSGKGKVAVPVFRLPTSVGSDGRRQGRAGSEGQRTALISSFFSSDQQAVRLTRRPGATRSRPNEPERVVPRSGARSGGDSQRCPSPPPRCPEAGADCLRTARRVARARASLRVGAVWRNGGL